jgi:hypothetical protein
LILSAGVLGLEQQDQFRRQIRDAVSRICLPWNRSSAQPAATYQGVPIPANCCATSLGVQQENHLAWRASISPGDSSMPPLGSCSLTAGIYQRSRREPQANR